MGIWRVYRSNTLAKFGVKLYRMTDGWYTGARGRCGRVIQNWYAKPWVALVERFIDKFFRTLKGSSIQRIFQFFFREGSLTLQGEALIKLMAPGIYRQIKKNYDTVSEPRRNIVIGEDSGGAQMT